MSTAEPNPRPRPVPRPLPADFDPEFSLPKHQRRFDRTARLLGDGAMARLERSRVAVFGVGGVGSFAVEALVRGGVGHLVLIDFDDICVTNTNRQLHTLKGTIGQAKVTAMAERCLAINPRVEVEVVEGFYRREGGEAMLDGRELDFVVDAIDNITAKCHLLDALRRRAIPTVTSLGAAARLDPTSVRVADLRDTYNDPLARDVRAILRSEYGWDMQVDTGLRAVFSIERPVQPVALYYDQASGGFQCVCPPKEDRGHTCEDRVQIEGSVGFVTGAFGLACASVVLNQLGETGRGPKNWRA